MNDQKTQLLEIMQENHHVFFHSPAGVPYVTVPVDDGGRITYRVRSEAYRHILMHAFFSRFESVPGRDPLQAAIDMAEGYSVFRGDAVPVSIRVAGDEWKRVVIDHTPGKAVVITPDGWKVTTDFDERFYRPRAAQDVRTPEEGGSIDELREFVNISERDWPLYIALLTASMRPSSSYPIGFFFAPQGSAKSSTMRITGRLIDPHGAQLRGAPKTEQDLFVAGGNAHVLAFDNLSYIPSELSDGMCSVATGRAYASRQLYSDGEEHVVQVCKPQLMNGVTDLVSRPDLADRAVVFDLPPISQMIADDVLASRFKDAEPRILGALYTAISKAMRCRPRTTPRNVPRMVGFTLWGMALSEALGMGSDFLSLYQENRSRLSHVTFEKSIIGYLILDLMRQSGDEWRGTSQELHKALHNLADDDVRRSKHFPASGRGVTSEIQRLEPVLRSIHGIGHREDRSADRREHVLFRMPSHADVPDDASLRHLRHKNPVNPMDQEDQADEGPDLDPDFQEEEDPDPNATYGWLTDDSSPAGGRLVEYETEEDELDIF